MINIPKLRTNNYLSQNDKQLIDNINTIVETVNTNNNEIVETICRNGKHIIFSNTINSIESISQNTYNLMVQNNSIDQNTLYFTYNEDN